MSKLKNIKRSVNRLFQSTPHSAQLLLRQHSQQARFLAVDLELTGLDSRRDEIVSIGWQTIEQQQLSLEQSRYSICKSPEKGTLKLAQSPSIHGITERQQQTGIETQKILQQLAPFADTHIWVFHNAELDMAFLVRYLNSFQCMPSAIVCLDTLQLQRYLLHKSSLVVKSNDATLAASRRYFNLPESHAHHAFDDAFATAELLLAQLYQLSAGQEMLINDLQHTKAIRVWR